MTIIPLINQDTGEFDMDAIKVRAAHRAVAEWGGQNPPDSYIRMALYWAVNRANDERLEWRRARGLPDDSPTTTFTSYAPDTNE